MSVYNWRLGYIEDFNLELICFGFFLSTFALLFFNRSLFQDINFLNNILRTQGGNEQLYSELH